MESFGVNVLGYFHDLYHCHLLAKILFYVESLNGDNMNLTKGLKPRNSNLTGKKVEAANAE